MADLDEPVIFQLKVVLLGISPTIWRRLLVHSNSTVADLHYILQIALGWTDSHLHQFIIHGKRYGIAQVGCVWFSEFKRTFLDGNSEIRYIREMIFGNKRQTQYWEITTDPETLPAKTTGFVMTHVGEITYREVGNLYGLKTWVEYGIKQSKSELGWADFRMAE